MGIEQTPPGSPTADWIESERAHERQMAHFKADQEKAERQQRRFVMEQWTTRIGYITVGLVVIAIVLGIASFIWDATNRGRAKAERLELACIEQGGTWTSIAYQSPAGCYRIATVEEGGQ